MTLTSDGDDAPVARFRPDAEGWKAACKLAKYFMSDLIKAAVEEMDKLDAVQENVVYEKPEQKDSDDTTDPNAILDALRVRAEKRVSLNTSRLGDLNIIDSTSDHLEFTTSVTVDKVVDGSTVDTYEFDVYVNSTSIAGGYKNDKNKLEIEIEDKQRGGVVLKRNLKDHDLIEEIRSAMFDAVIDKL